LGAFFALLMALPLALLPARWACWWAGRWVTPAWWLARRRRRVTLSNLRQVYGRIWSDERITRVARESWRRVALSAVEALQIRRWLATPGFHDRIDWVGPWEELERRHQAGEAFLLVSGHLGPFEVVLPTLVHRGWRIDLLSRHIKNGYVHQAMHWLRSGTVPGILDPSGALPEMGRSLRSGCCLAMLVDQNTRGGLHVPFLGREAGTVPVVGVLQRRYRVPVIYLHSRRLEEGSRYRLHCEIAEFPEGEDLRQHIDGVTRAVNAKIEHWVRENPADWLWMHQRWKHRADGTREQLLPEK
jgi:KDO2-lipid IV(A) lauroyltransferase